MHKNSLGSYNAVGIHERMINMHSTITNEPLLYIVKPNLDVPKSKMQVDFYTSTEQVQTPNTQQHHKSFKQYSIAEKIHYLIHFPKSLPRVKCEIVTNQGNYRGVLVQEHHHTILLENYKRRVEEIAISDIVDIYLISF